MIIKGDCRTIVPTLGLFDLIIADPPYGCTPMKWDVVCVGWSEVMAAALKPSGSLWVFGSMRNVPLLFKEFASWKFAQEIVWEKHNCSGPVTQRRFARVHEFVLQFYRGAWHDVFAIQQTTHGHARKAATRKNTSPTTGRFSPSHYDSTSRIARSVQKVRSAHGSATHPTEQPEDLLRLLIEYSCPPDGRVLDPFAGSGSTLRAAGNREAVGVERFPPKADEGE